jgi:hypothetical protein
MSVFLRFRYYETTCIGLFENGVVSHHKCTRPLRNFIAVFPTALFLFDDISPWHPLYLVHK